MNTPDPRTEPETATTVNTDEGRERTLARGLAAFDAAVASRRRRRQTLRAAIVVCCVSTLAVVGAFGIRAMSRHEPQPIHIARRALPAYVTIIENEVQLAAELEAANACERVARRGGELFVVECVHPVGTR